MNIRRDQRIARRGPFRGRVAPYPRYDAGICAPLALNACRRRRRRARGGTGAGLRFRLDSWHLLRRQASSANFDCPRVAMSRCDRQAPPPPTRRRRFRPLPSGPAAPPCARQALALRLEMLAFIEVVFGGIGESRRHVVAHAGAAGEPGPEREQRQRGDGARKWPAMGQRGGHRTFVSRQR